MKLHRAVKETSLFYWSLKKSLPRPTWQSSWPRVASSGTASRLLNAVCEWGGNVAACGLSQSITRHRELYAQAAGHTAVFLSMCVFACGCMWVTCLCWAQPWYRICAPSFFPGSCLCNWSQTGHLSCQQQFISFLSLRQALYCFQMAKALQGSSLFLKKSVML